GHQPLPHRGAEIPDHHPCARGSRALDRMLPGAGRHRRGADRGRGARIQLPGQLLVSGELSAAEGEEPDAGEEARQLAQRSLLTARAMWLGLAIRDIVLIDRLDLAFAPGLSVLTGETGAGKSILLDALGLALGARADAALLRRGASQASVTAEFDLPSRHPAVALLAEQGLAVEGNLLLRRQIGADGRSRALVNDQPVGVGLLRQIGDLVVEIVGQFEQHGLMDPATHGTMLDAHGGHSSEAVSAAWRGWRAATEARVTAEAEIAEARRDEGYLRHA